MSQYKLDMKLSVLQVTLARSCHGCIKSKRKCDRGLPRCKLCQERNKECVYKNIPGTSAVIPTRISTANSMNAEAIVARAQARLLGPSSPDLEDISMAFAAASLDNARIDPPDVIMRWDDETFSYILDQLRSIPETFVRTRGTLFIHPRLYSDGLPPLLQAMFTLCSVHLHQIDTGAPLAHDMIDNLSESIIKASTMAHTFTSILELVHAILLLQIVALLFPTTNKIREHDESRLWLLQNRAYALYQSVPATLSSSLSPYKAWILGESVRRTFHFVHKVRAIYTMQTRGYFRLTLFCESLPVNIASLLWDLDVPGAAAQTLRGSTQDDVPDTLTRQDLISYRELTDLWDRGQIETVGPFEELQLIACKGLKVKRRPCK